MTTTTRTTGAGEYTVRPVTDGLLIDGTWTARTGSEYSVCVRISPDGETLYESVAKRGAYGVPSWRATVPPTHKAGALEDARALGVSLMELLAPERERVAAHHRQIDAERLRKHAGMLEYAARVLSENAGKAERGDDYDAWPFGTIFTREAEQAISEDVRGAL